MPEMLKPVPPDISPLTPSPPTIDNAPDVEEVELALLKTDTDPIKVDEP